MTDPRIRLIEELRDELWTSARMGEPAGVSHGPFDEVAARLDAILSTPVSESVSPDARARLVELADSLERGVVPVYETVSGRGRSRDQVILLTIAKAIREALGTPRPKNWIPPDDAGWGAVLVAESVSPDPVEEYRAWQRANEAPTVYSGTPTSESVSPLAGMPKPEDSEYAILSHKGAILGESVSREDVEGVPLERADSTQLSENAGPPVAADPAAPSALTAEELLASVQPGEWHDRYEGDAYVEGLRQVALAYLHLVGNRSSASPDGPRDLAKAAWAAKVDLCRLAPTWFGSGRGHLLAIAERLRVAVVEDERRPASPDGYVSVGELQKLRDDLTPATSDFADRLDSLIAKAGEPESSLSHSPPRSSGPSRRSWRSAQSREKGES